MKNTRRVKHRNNTGHDLVGWFQCTVAPLAASLAS